MATKETWKHRLQALWIAWKRRALVMWIIVFSAAVLWAIHVNNRNTSEVHELVVATKNLGTANKTRITEIQRSRLESCRSSYQSFHAVFDPFFPPVKNRTAKQKRQFAKFNRIIANKIKHCQAQVTPPPVKPTKGNR